MQVKRMPKEIKKWDVYSLRLAGEIKNMSIVVPLVAQLASPSMQDRHWKSVLALVQTVAYHRYETLCAWFVQRKRRVTVKKYDCPLFPYNS